MSCRWRVKKISQKSTNPNGTMIQHPFTDLKSVSPVLFSYLLKECYRLGKDILKFKALKKNVYEAFLSSSVPGLATFVVRCLYVFPIFPALYDGLAHMVLSAFLPLINQASYQDIVTAKFLAARLFILSVSGSIAYDHLTMLKIVQTFDVKTEEAEKAMLILKSENADLFTAENPKTCVEEHTWRMILSNHYEMAAGFLHHFSMRNSEEKLLLRMIAHNRLGTADKWACFIGPRLIRILVREYARLNMWKLACTVISNNNMREEFPEIFFEYRKSVIKKFAKRCLWDLAEERTKGDRQLIEYLVLTTIELGCSEMADELCARYSLNHLKGVKGPGTFKQTLKLENLNMNGIIFIDKSERLCNATLTILQSEVVGLDCEWKINYYKLKFSKVSILQISTETVVYIVDLIKLSNENPQVLDHCLRSIFRSTSLLKIGYDFKCDMKQLTQSYERFGCFREFKMLLDFSNLFKESHGGLSGLSEKILGLKLDKTKRATDWEKRPLSQGQLEYAALDAAALVHIFHRVRDGVAGHSLKDEWKSKIVCDVVRCV